MIEFLFGSLARVAILLLAQGDKLIGLAPHMFQVVVGEFAPPLSDLTSHVLVHPVAGLFPSNSLPSVCAGAPGGIARRLPILTSSGGFGPRVRMGRRTSLRASSAAQHEPRQRQAQAQEGQAGSQQWAIGQGSTPGLGEDRQGCGYRSCVWRVRRRCARSAVSSV